MKIPSKKLIEKNNATEAIDRRKFMITTGNTAVGIASAGILGLTYKFLSSNIQLEIPSIFQAGAPDNYKPGTVIFNEQYRIFIVRNEQGYFYALSAVCTHLGCLIHWRPAGVPGKPQAAISCPCHGSLFSKLGHVISGPAPRPLDRFRMQFKDGKLFVDTKKIVSEKNMYLKI